MRAIVGYILLFVFVLPAAISNVTGYRFFGQDWQDAAFVNTWLGVFIWALLITWITFPLVMSVFVNPENSSSSTNRRPLSRIARFGLVIAYPVVVAAVIQLFVAKLPISNLEKTNANLNSLIKASKKLRLPDTGSSYNLAEWKIDQIVNACQKIKTEMTTSDAQTPYSEANEVCRNLVDKVRNKTVRSADADLAADTIRLIALKAYSELNGGDGAERKRYGISVKQQEELVRQKSEKN